VPVLRHGDLAMVQSGAILEYLSEYLGRFGATDTGARQNMREWLFWDADRLAPPIYRSYGYELGRQGLLPITADPAVVAQFREAAEAALAVLDNALAARAWRSGLDLARWPHLHVWAVRFGALPGCQAPLDLLPMADAASL
jgi:glutathione S-transferase